MLNSPVFRLGVLPVLKLVAYMFHTVCHYKTYRKLSLFSDYVYSLWISHEFKCIGSDSIVYKLSRLEGGKHIEIGHHTVIGKYSVLTAWTKYRNQILHPQITIGSNCDLGEYLHLTCINCIKIGDGVLTGRWVTISDNSHGVSTSQDMMQKPVHRQVISKGAIEIADNVWIGDKVTILSGVKIGEGAIVAANSVVNKNVPSYSVVAGCPAKVVKQISKDL